MRLDNLGESIDPLVLMRGQEYHRDGRVVALEQAGDNAWRAEVEGTDDYEVQVEWDTEGELSSACTCPYDGGPVCKHVIAVLLAIADAQPETHIAEAIQISPSGSGQVRTILDGLSHEALVDILVGLAENDREISLDLRARFGAEPFDKATALRLAREALRLGEDRHGSIDYWGASRAASGLDSLLSRAGMVLGGGRAGEAVPIAQAVLESAAGAYGNADDSMGLLGDCIGIALNLLREAGAHLDETQRRELLDYCLALAPAAPYRGFDWGWELAQVAADLIAQPDERSRVSMLLDTMAELHAGEGAGFRTGIVGYDRETAAQIKLSVVEREDGAQAGLRLIQDHIHLDAFRERLIQHHLERGELAEVKRLSTDWLAEHSAAGHAHPRYHLDTLLEVARREEDTPEVLRLARLLLLYTGDLKYYELIKRKLPARAWPETLGALIQDLEPTSRGWVVLPEIYGHEGMWEQLLERALRAGEPLLERYRDGAGASLPGGGFQGL